MRIAFITPEYITEKNFYGGLSNYVHRVSLALKDMGHQPVIFVSSDKKEVLYHGRIEIHRIKPSLPLGLFFISSFLKKYLHQYWLEWLANSYALNRELRKTNEKGCFDIVQYSSYMATGFFRLKKIPSVVRISSLQSLFRERRGESPCINDRMIELFERMSFRRADGIFGPSKIVANSIEECINKKVKIIKTPFLMDVTPKKMEHLKEEFSGKKYLLFFGSLKKAKGVQVIAQIIFELLDNHPDLFFAFVGKNCHFNDKTMLDYVYEKAGKHKDRVIYFSEMGHPELYPIIQNAYAIVLPSLIDNFPNACLEAMYFKKIVIGTDGASFEDIIDNGRSGFLCKPNNPESLRMTIEKVLSISNNEKEAIEKNARLIINNLAPEKVVIELINFYDEIIKQKNTNK